MGQNMPPRPRCRAAAGAWALPLREYGHCPSSRWTECGGRQIIDRSGDLDATTDEQNQAKW